MNTFKALVEKMVDANTIYYSGQSYENESVTYLVGDWNAIERRQYCRLDDIAEHYGCELMFEDSVISDDQGRLHLSQPQCYGDGMTWHLLPEQCEIWARDTAQEETESYLNECSETGGAAKVHAWSLSPADHGWKHFNYKAESGFHYGQNDTGEALEAMVREKHGEDIDVLFAIDGAGQFDIQFSAWWRPQEA